MRISELNENDRTGLFITFAVGIILGIFLHNGMNITLSVYFMYILNKYMATTNNLKEYDGYEFLDKEKYNRGKKKYVILANIYILIRIITLFFIKHYVFILGELYLIVMLSIPYDNYLSKKYILKINIEHEKIVFMRNKLLTITICISFVVLTILSISTLIKDNDYINYGQYEYNLTHDKDNKKILEVKLGSLFMRSEENNKNTKYFKDYIKDTKELISIKIFKNYTFISMILMVILIFTQVYPKNIDTKTTSMFIFFIGFLIFSILNFNIDTNEREANLTTYFHQYMSR